MKEINVKTGQLYAANGEGTLISLGIGSCVVICLYDEKKNIGGMAHIMLPEKSKAKHDSGAPGQFADLAVKNLVEEMLKLGAKREDIEAKMAGGAEMFRNLRSNHISLGERNIIAVRQALEEEEIKLTSEDTGGTSGRSIKFFLDSGEIEVRKRL